MATTPEDEAALSVDPNDSTYEPDTSPELDDQNPPHGPQVVQTRGEPSGEPAARQSTPSTAKSKT